MNKHIGIAAVSPEGAALCYRAIYRHAADMLNEHDFPIVSIHNIPLAHYVGAVRSNDWRTVGDLLKRSADALAALGAEVCLCPDNGVQLGVQMIEATSPLQWLSMIAAVGDAVVEDRCTSVGIIGTSTVTLGSVYQTQLGLKGVKVVAPSTNDAEAMDRIIYNELVYGQVRESSRTKCGAVMAWFKERGCQGIILGCSEAPLIVTPGKTELHLYDTTDLIAKRAAQYAAGMLV